MWKSKLRFLIPSATPPRPQSPSLPNHLLSSKTLIPSPHFPLPFSQTPKFYSTQLNPIDPIPLFDQTPNFLPQHHQNPNFFPSPHHDDDDQNPIFIPQQQLESQTLAQEQDFEFESENHPHQNDEKKEGSSVSEEEQETLDTDMEQVEKVLSLLQSSLNESLQSNLDALELNLNDEFVVKILETPFVPPESLLAFFRWVWGKPEFTVTTRVLRCLVGSVSKGRKKKVGYALWDLVKEVGDKESGVLDTQSLNELICLFWNLGKGKAGLEVFDKFDEFGCERDADSYYFTIEALCRRGSFDWAWNVCEKMLNAGELPDGGKIGNVICCFCRGSKAKDAHLVYLMAKEKKKLPRRSAVNFLINCLCKEDGNVTLALEMLEDFEGDARKYAILPFSSVVRGLCRMKDMDAAKKLLNKMIHEGPPPGNAVFNDVINGLSKAGEMVEAMDLVKVMESRGLLPDVYTYSVIISGYAKGGQMEDAHKVLEVAKKNHSKLTPVTYHALIRGHCKLEEFDKAIELLNEMKEGDVKPNADEYNKLIQSLCLKALDWNTAEKLFEEMKEKGLYLNGITRSLIRAVKEMEQQELNAEGDIVEE